MLPMEVLVRCRNSVASVEAWCATWLYGKRIATGSPGSAHGKVVDRRGILDLPMPGSLNDQELVLDRPRIEHRLGRDTEPFPGLLDAVGVKFDPDGVPA